MERNNRSVFVRAAALLSLLLLLGVPAAAAGSPAAQEDQTFLFLPMVSGGGGAPDTGAWQTLLEDDFEGEFPGPWSFADNTEYGWGLHDCIAASGEISAWAVGGGSLGAELACDSNYPDNISAWMIAGPFDLSDATAADLSFNAWVNTEMNADFLYWGASTDGDLFELFWVTGDTEGWAPLTLNLSDVNDVNYLGQAQVWIAFRFVSNEEENLPGGASIDDVLLRKCTGGTCSGVKPNPTEPAGASSKLEFGIH